MHEAYTKPHEKMRSNADLHEPPPIASVPVTIVTGFLGAGKTTLLRHVLASPHGLKIAVIQNELSASAGLEASTMVGPNGEEFANWLELANGCVCCEVRDELARGIERLMELKGAFDYVLVETTGMADPGPVAEQFWLDAELESPLKLDGIVAVVDAVHFWRHARDLETCRQVACADVILINKVDALEQQQQQQHDSASTVVQGLLHREQAAPSVESTAVDVSAEAREDALAPLAFHLRKLNALAPQMQTTRSRVPLEKILNLRAYDSGAPTAKATAKATEAVARVREAPFSFSSGAVRRKGRPQPSSKAAAVATSDGSEGGKGGGTGGGDRDGSQSEVGGERTSWLHQDSAFGAITLEESAPMDRAKIDALFATLFWEPEGFAGLANAAIGRPAPTSTAAAQEPTADSAAGVPPPEIFRAKGVLGFAGCDNMWTLQAVHSTFEVCEANRWDELEGEAAPQRGVTRLVFIGRHLSQRRLAAALSACRVAPDEV